MPSETVKVMVRVRPFNEREKAKNYEKIATADAPAMQVSLANPINVEAQKVFTYDAVFPPETAQQTVYEQAAFQLVESVLEGYNGTIFAYGQTGCGKTHTMMGAPDNENTKGIIPRAFAHIFGNIESTAHKNFLIRCSYIEIYNEEIHDLVGADVRAKLEMKESADKGLFIKNVSMHIVKSIAEIEKIMLLGMKNRSVGETLMNKDSSRSHTVFTIYIEAAETDAKGNQKITLGKLNLVDLAGSERQSKTQATGDRLKEANKINLSLSALGNVISALVDGKSSHIPYRDSKLTRLLQDSLGGNTKTVMIANISPAADSYDETLGTLRYASRAKNIKNQPRVNQDPKDALLKEYADEIQRLKALLENGGLSGQNGDNSAIGLSGGRKGKFMDDMDESYHSSKRQKTRDGNDDGYEEQIRRKNEEILNERKKREELESKLVGMQSQLVVGGTAIDNKGSSAEPEEKKRYQEMLQKIREHKKEHEELVKEKEKKDEEIALVEKRYVSLQEEVEEQRKIIYTLKKRYRAAVDEIKDLEKEHEANKEDLLDTIRLLERDIQVNNMIMSYMLSPEELDRIKAAARWDDESNEFIIPPFVIRNKKVNFPKISRAKGLEMINEEWKNRDIEFQEEESYEQENHNVGRHTREKESKRASSNYSTNKEFEKTANGTQSNFFKKKTLPRKSIERNENSQPESRESHRKTPLRLYDKAAIESQVSTTRDAVYSALQNVSKIPNALNELAFKKKNPLRNVQLEPISMPQGTKQMEESRSNFSKGFQDTGYKVSTMHSIGMHDGLPPLHKGAHYKQPISLNEISNRMNHHYNV